METVEPAWVRRRFSSARALGDQPPLVISRSAPASTSKASGWARALGVRHERLLFLDRKADELRGEDRLTPTGTAHRARALPMAVRFHLAPQVRATLARDGKSVLVQGASGPGWWLRNDAAEASIEGSVHIEDGEPKRTLQVVLRSQVDTQAGARIRWKLAVAAG